MSTVKKHAQNLTYFFHSQLDIHMFLTLPTAYHSKIIIPSKCKILKWFKGAQSLHNQLLGGEKGKAGSSLV